MNGQAFQRDFLLLDRTRLLRFRLKALRRGVWFRLSRIDRAIVDLAILVNARFRSFRLIKSILSVMDMLREPSKNRFERAVSEIGVPLATRLSLLAHKWGNKSAKDWPKDIRFVRFLTMIRLDGNPSMHLDSEKDDRTNATS